MDIVRAKRRYAAKYTGQYLSDIYTAFKTDMVNAFTTRAQELVALENQVRGLLAGEAVVTTDYPKYHAFAHAVYAKKARFGGGSGLVDETAVILAGWKSRGCTEAILDKIRNEVFAIPAPAAP